MPYPTLLATADFHAADAVARHVETDLQREIGPIMGNVARDVIGVIQPRPLEFTDEVRLNAPGWFNGIVVESDRPIISEQEKPKFPIRLPVLLETEEVQLRRIMVSHDLASEDRADDLAKAVRSKIEHVLEAYPSAHVSEKPRVSIYNPLKDVDPDRYIPLRAGYRP